MLQTMSAFLRKIFKAHSEEFLVMVLDGAPSHRRKDLVVPENMRLVFLPQYSPELNPAELLWDELWEKNLANRVFDSLSGGVAQLRQGLQRLRRNPKEMASLTGWQNTGWNGNHTRRPHP
jgi:transposase